MRQIIVDITQCTIIQRDISDDLWPKIILAMVEVKSLRPASALSEKSSLKVLEKKLPKLDHLQAFGATVYVLIHEEKK